MTSLDSLLKHVQMPESQRDLNWEKSFLKLFAETNVSLLTDAPESGPDNFPYLLVETRPDSTESVFKVMEWLAAKGIGLVVNPQKNYPDFIFSYGMIWNFQERREFLTDSLVQADKVFELSEGQRVLAGAPHAQYLPDYVRSIIKQFLLDQAVLRPRILVVGKSDQQATSFFDLCFSIESLGNPPSHEHEGILKALSWFLPQHYSLALVSEKGLPSFIDL